MKIKIFEGITRNIFILGLVSLFTDLSSQMVFPLIPLFMVTVLGTGVYAVGIVEGAAETTASFLKVVSGYWSDKIGKRKPFVMFGYSLSAITKPLFAFANIWSFVLFIRVIERIGKGIRTAPRDAIVAESSDKSVIGKAYGFHRFMDGIGSVLGAAIAYFLLPVFGYRNMFIFALIPGMIAVLIIMFIKEKKKASEEYKINEMSIKLTIKELPLNLKLFLMVSVIFGLGHFGYAFLLMRVLDIGLDDQIAILFYIIFYIVYAVCAIPFGILSDQIGRRTVLRAGYVLFGITSFGLIFATNVYSISGLFVSYGIFYAMIDGAQRAFVVDLAPKDIKATALGTFHTSIGLVALPGGYIAGLLWDKISPETTFIYGLTLTIISLILFTFVKDK
jgi:MFS family permease